MGRVNKNYGKELANGWGGGCGTWRDGFVFCQVAKSHKTTDWNELVPRR